MDGCSRLVEDLLALTTAKSVLVRGPTHGGDTVSHETRHAFMLACVHKFQQLNVLLCVLYASV